MAITLYTQPRCTYCEMMQSKLDKTGYVYYVINIQEDPKAKEFMKSEGHRTVPQLYVNDNHINKRNTQDYTSDELYELISQNLNRWAWQDSGVEQGF